MGKRKKSSRKPTGAKRREPLATTFACIFCHHEGSVSVRIDRKEGVGNLVCRVCDQRYQGKVNHLSEAIDVYSEWIDAAEAAQDEPPARRIVPSSSRAAAAPPRRTEVDSDDE